MWMKLQDNLCDTSAIAASRARQYRAEGILNRLKALLYVLTCTAIASASVVAQQSRPPVDFPAWEELMQDAVIPGSQRRSGSTADDVSTPWPVRSNEPASTPLQPRFDTGGTTNKELPNPFRNYIVNEEKLRGGRQPAGDNKTNAEPISQRRYLEGDRENVRGTGDSRDSGFWLREQNSEENNFRGGGRYNGGNPEDPGRKFLTAEQELGAPNVAPEFDWNQQRTSVADLRFPASTMFEHNNGTIARQERNAYLDLIATSEYQWQRLVQANLDAPGTTRTPRAEWEEAFYRYAEIRRKAWANGKLQAVNAPAMLGKYPDPFGEATAAGPNSSATEKYRLLKDIANYPQHFVGRPIVLYGRFTADSEIRIEPDSQSASMSTNRFGGQRTAAGAFGQFDGDRIRTEQFRGGANRSNGTLPPVAKAQKLLRGSLTGLTTSEKLAMVDTKGLITPSGGLLGINESWRTETNVPVLIKGWVVKNWKDNRPLIYCDSMRLVTPRPQVDLVRKNSVDKRRLRDEETWLYYETLKQLELTSHRLQKEISAAALQQRIDNLMGDIMETSRSELVKLSDALTSGTISETTQLRRKSALERRLQQRLKRYKDFRRHPEKFQTYVDMFQHPEAWHGDLVTLRGHVRHVVSYPADDVLFGGRILHELWLFTDDSQHNPAVIITPNLPADFPMDADVIDYVSVTGCFFKRYVYGSQDTDRIAPLILASHIGWQPTVDQVQGMVADGVMSAGSPRAKRAAAIAGDRTGQAAVLLGAFLVLMVFMILWGRAQREERDRVHLRKVVNEVPVFENPIVDSYSSLLSDFSDHRSPDYQSSGTLPSNKYRP